MAKTKVSELAEELGIDKKEVLDFLHKKNVDAIMDVYETLKKAHRLDLVGFGKNCLIRPRAKDNNSKINITKSKKNSKKR